MHRRGGMFLPIQWGLHRQNEDDGERILLYREGYQGALQSVRLPLLPESLTDVWTEFCRIAGFVH